MTNSLFVFALAVGFSYIYAFVGGFTDAANAIATSVGTKVLRPRTAVVMAGIFNLLGGLTGTAVAVTIASGIVDPSVLNLGTVVAAVAGAMTWSLITYFFGIPVSETHGLIGGLIGAGAATAGWDVVEWDSVREVIAAIGASPVPHGRIDAEIRPRVGRSLQPCRDPRRMAREKYELESGRRLRRGPDFRRGGGRADCRAHVWCRASLHLVN
jgi:phosphate/sulfate permease